MRRNVLLLSILFGSAISIFAEPYKPAPIIFIHGYTSGSGTWGASTKDPIHDRKEEICKDSVLAHPEATYSHFLNYMIPIVVEWWNYEEEHNIPHTYTRPQDAGYPNKTFLEVVNMDDPWGSINEDDDWEYWSHEYPCWEVELYHRVKEVLKEYYGDNWETNPEAKVILIGHSTESILNCKLKNERI